MGAVVLITVDIEIENSVLLPKTQVLMSTCNCSLRYNRCLHSFISQLSCYKRYLKYAK